MKTYLYSGNDNSSDLGSGGLDESVEVRSEFASNNVDLGLESDQDGRYLLLGSAVTLDEGALVTLHALDGGAGEGGSRERGEDGKLGEEHGERLKECEKLDVSCFGGDSRSACDLRASKKEGPHRESSRGRRVK